MLLAVGEKNNPLLALGPRRLGFTLERVPGRSFSSETSPAGAAVYTVARFFRLPRSSRFESADCAMAARRTERFTDHATMPRHASNASPMSPRMAPTAMKTVPSGMFVVRMYGAFAVGGTVTMGPLAGVEEEVDVVLSVVVVEVEVEVEVDEVVVVVVAILVVLVVVDGVGVVVSDVVVGAVEVGVVEVGDNSDVEEGVSAGEAVVSVTLGVVLAGT